MTAPLLVLGASGGVGRCLVDQAVALGLPVRVLVRASSPYQPPEGVEAIRGEVLEPGVLAACARGCDVVLSALGHRRANLFPYSPLRSPEDLNERVAELVIAAGIRRFVGVSAAGVGDSWEGTNLILRALIRTSTIGYAYRDLERMEERFRASDVDWCLPRPVTLTDGPPTGRVRVVQGFPTTATIRRADVAGWMLEHRQAAPSRTPTLAGP